jgi:glutathione S-transferase
MPKLKLSYFDFHGGRGETARIALHIGGIEYEDDRIAFPDWKARKAGMIYGAIPQLDIDGTLLAQSNGINRYVGKLAGLYPQDALQAALCDEVMDAVEDVASKVLATFGIEDKAELEAKRTALADGPLTFYYKAVAGRLEGRGDWFADNRLTVADIKVFLWVRHVANGGLDFVPADLPKRVAPALAEHFERVKTHDKIKAYYAHRGVDA